MIQKRETNVELIFFLENITRGPDTIQYQLWWVAKSMLNPSNSKDNISLSID